MTTEFGESIKEKYTEYKYVTPTLRVHTSGDLSIFNAVEEDWEDAKLDSKNCIKYWNVNTQKGMIEKQDYLVARAFIPNPLNYQGIRHKDGVLKNCEVNNLEWYAIVKKPTNFVGYSLQKDRWVVRIYDKITKKTKHYGSYYTQAEAEARVAEIRPNS